MTYQYYMFEFINRWLWTVVVEIYQRRPSTKFLFQPKHFQHYAVISKGLMTEVNCTTSDPLSIIRLKKDIAD